MRKRVKMRELADNVRASVTCPRCGCSDFRVYGVRKYESQLAIRYKECRNCGNRLITSTVSEEKIIRSVYQ